MKKALSFLLAAVMLVNVGVPCGCGQSVSESSENIKGDIDSDGNVTSADALLILRRSVGLESFDDNTEKRADIDGDSDITSNDVLEVLRMSSGLSGTNKTNDTVNNENMSGTIPETLEQIIMRNEGYDSTKLKSSWNLSSNSMKSH